jgi:predicted ATPase
MKITKLSLTNFRSFKETQTIEFAPVTLLFGPNSVGKSTVLMALFYLQQILARGQCDPARIDALGGKFVGGFKNLINGKNIDNSIKLKLEYDKGDAIGSTYSYLTDLIGEQVNIAINSPASEARKIAIEFEISWSKSQETAYISNYKIWFDDIEIAEVNSDAGLKQPMVTAFNYLHPLLLPDDHDDWLVDCFDNQVEIHNDLLDKVLNLKNIYNPTHNEIKDGAECPLDIDEDAPVFTDTCFVSEFHELLNSSRIPYQDYNNSNFMTLMDNSTLLHAPIGIKGTNGALPLIGQPLQSSLSINEEKLDAVIGELLSDVIIAPLDNLLTLLNDSLCIGPLRHIPDANYQQNPYPTQADWYDGKACWDELISTDLIRDTSINKWLTDEDKLNLGYKIVYKVEGLESRYISPSIKLDKVEDIKAMFDAIGDQLSITVSKEDPLINPSTLQTSVNSIFEEELEKDKKSKSDLCIGQNIVKQTTNVLWDCHNNIEISASDIGVGVSQLLPLVVATQITKRGIIACEQPELHVHPRVQVAIGDLLTQANNKANFLIETHSEHLILRLLRRVRETTDNELPEGKLPVKSEDISVVFLSNSENGVMARRIDVTSDGDFHEDWPGGFFDERDEELF